MRKKALVISIEMSINPMSIYHRGPISPYSNVINQFLYHQMLGQTTLRYPGQKFMTPVSPGKTPPLLKEMLYAERYTTKTAKP